MRTEEEIKGTLNAIADYWMLHPNMKLMDVMEVARREVDVNLKLETMEDREMVNALGRLNRRSKNPGAYFSSF